MPDSLGIVIPALNAAARLGATLECVAGAGDCIVVDGGSTDGTIDVARGRGATVIEAEKGRGVQLQAGAGAASGDWLLFLHADTVLRPGWRHAVQGFMAEEGNRDRAGYFHLRLDYDSRAALRIERLAAWRNKVLGLPYGDQGLLIHRSLYDRLGGYRPMVLYEDVDLVRRIGRRRLVALDASAVTSAQRYHRGGFVLRPLRNLFCLGLYFLHVPPALIARLYG